MKLVYLIFATFIWMTIATSILLRVYGLNAGQLDKLANQHETVLACVLASVPLALILLLWRIGLTAPDLPPVMLPCRLMSRQHHRR